LGFLFLILVSLW